MEVVCLILGPMLNLPTLFACFLGFDIPASFIFIENVFFIILASIVCFF